MVWLVLVAAFVTRLLADRSRWLSEAGLPSALTLVAGTAVLGSWLSATDRPAFAQGLLVVGLVLWAVLMPPVVGHWSTPTVGTSFLVCVAPQALAVLAAGLARETDQHWEMYASAAAFVVGLAMYGVAVHRFDFRQVLLGKGDQWVLGGALATVFPLSMAALASLHLSRVLHQPALWGLGHVLSWLALAVWVVVAAGSLRRVRAVAVGSGQYGGDGCTGPG